MVATPPFASFMCALTYLPLHSAKLLSHSQPFFLLQQYLSQLREWEWGRFDPAQIEPATKEEGEGSGIICHAKKGLRGSVPCWKHHLSCHNNKSGKSVAAQLNAVANI